MKDPVRLLSDPNATPFERNLLASWSDEQPSSAARMRALGIAGVAAAAAAAGTAATVGALAPKASTLFSFAALAKWTILAVVLVGGSVATYAVVHRSSSSTSEPAVVAVAPVAPPVIPPASTVVTPVTPLTETPTLSPADLPAAVDAPAPSNTAQAAARQGAAPAPSSLGEEIALFDRARTALDGGDANGALALVDTYERRFPSGAFAQEAEVLRVQALLRKGDRTGASRVGERFLAAHPTSPHAARIRAILSPSER